MTNTSRNMPNSYHQGYCYFDVKTGKFWIDTTDTAAGRLAINSSFFGICAADQASVEVKTVTCPGYVRSVGSSVYVMFAANDTYGIMNRLALNVNNTGAAVVQHHGETPDKAWCKAGHVYNFVYDGEYYQLIGDLDTTYNTLTTAIGRTGTDTEARLISASTLKTLIDDRGYTTNTGTVTNVATGAGLTGGPITTSGTIKANLLSEAKLSYDAAAGTSGNTNRIYPVALDKSGRLSVNVPWVDNNTNTTYTFADGVSGNFTVTPLGGSAQTISIGKPATAGTADKLGSSTVGSLSNPIYLNGGVATASSGYTVEYIVGTQTAATGSWTGITKDSELVTGKVIAYKLPYAGSGSASLTLTFTNPSGNENSGNIPVYLNNTRVTTHYAANSVILMVYDGTNWRSTDYWNGNNRDAGYGKISLTQSDANTAITTNTTQLVAATYNEAMTVAAGNKWVQLAGTNGSQGADILTVGHSLSDATAGSYGDSSAQTPAYGETFNVPYITIDAAGHVTGISSHTVKIPASDNTTYSAGTGLSLSDTTFNHSNSVTAKTAAAQAAKTLTWDGTFTLYEEKYDSQGHITGVASYNMTMPSNPNTDYKVRQTNDTSTNANYRLLLSNNANSTQEDNITHKNDNLTYNPSTMTLSTGNLNLTGKLDVVGNAYLHNETQTDSLTAGSLLVTGATSFTQIPTAPTPDASSNDTSVATTAFVTSALTGVSSPMRFIGSLGTGGTATTLPAASTANQGYTYKVITANTYQGVVAKVGDVLVSNGSSWILIPSGDEPSGTVTNITAGTGLNTSANQAETATKGSITESGTLYLTTTGVTANSYGPASDVIGNDNAEMYVPYITVDAYGRVTGIENKKYTAKNSTYTVGSKALNIASNTGTATQAIGVNESSQDRTLTIKGDGTYITGAVSGSSNAATVTLSHADPTADANSELTASLSGTAGTYALNTEFTVLTGVKAQRDAKGHITGLTYTAQKIKDTNTTYTFDGTYNASTNKAATVSTVTNAINGLDVSNISGFGAGKTLKTLTETDGKIAATFQDISITTSQITDFPHYWADKETTSTAAYNAAPEMATIKLNGNTSASAASTTNVTLVYDSTLQALNFVFA